MAKVLIVDDSSFQRRTIRTLLCGLGHEVSEGADGAAGVDSLLALTRRVEVLAGESAR